MRARHRKRSNTRVRSLGRSECRAIFAVLSEFLDGTLPPRNCRELRKHLGNCKPCVEYLNSLRGTVDLCHAYKTVTAPPPSSVVRQAFAQALSKKPTRRTL